MLLDWQGILWSRGVHDLAYLLTLSLTVADRRQVESELIAVYCEALGSHGVEYSRAQCREDLRVAILYCLAHVVATAGTIKNDSERAAKRRLVVVERGMACLDDWQALQLL